MAKLNIGHRLNLLHQSLIAILFSVGFLCLSLFMSVHAQINIQEFVVPTSNVTPSGITYGPDGNIWFTEFDGNKIGKITPQGVITEYTVPTANSKPVDIMVGPDNNLWFLEWSSHKVARMTTSGVITEYTVPVNTHLESITLGPDGNLWFTGSFDATIVGKITLDGTITTFAAPSGSSPHGITTGPDSNIWFTEAGTNKIAKMNPSNGNITEYNIPTPNSVPFDIKVGPDGNLWFAEWKKPNIGRITTSGVITEFPIPSGLGALFMTLGNDGTFWFTDADGNKIGNVTMSGSITTYPVPTSNSFPHSITTDSSGNVWFTEWYGNKIGLISLNQPPTVDAGGPYTVDEGGSVNVTATGNDPENGPLTFAWDLDNNGSFETSGQTVTFSAASLDGFTTKTINVQVTDNGNLTATDEATINVVNVSPTVGTITAPTDPVLVNTQINTNVSFTDPGIPDTHTAVWDWGDISTSTGTVDEQNHNITGNHSYATPGVYEIKVTVTDDDSGSDDSIYQYVVVYDNSASGGFVTGAGTIDSPDGAYVPNTSLTGIAKFGFVSKYQPGANTPTGNTQFKFQAADFTFTSTTYQWLVVAGAQAKFKGAGTVNGSGSYGFQLFATDGAINGGGGVDKFRIKIWDKNNNDTVVYDNNIGASDNVSPTTELTGGNIIIH